MTPETKGALLGLAIAALISGALVLSFILAHL